MDLTNRKQRGIIFKEYDGRCFYCGRELDAFGDWHIDHANPKSRGGTDDEDNLRLACHTCNIVKNDRTIEEYRQYLTEYYADKIGGNVQMFDTVFLVYGFPPAFVRRFFTMFYVILNRLEGRRLKFYGEGGVAFYRQPISGEQKTESKYDSRDRLDSAASEIEKEFGFDKDSGESKDEKE